MTQWRIKERSLRRREISKNLCICDNNGVFNYAVSVSMSPPFSGS